MTSLAVSQEIKNDTINDLSFRSHSKVGTTFHSTDHDNNGFTPDMIDKKGKSYSGTEDYRSDKLDVDDGCAEPEVEFPFHVNRSASFRFNSFKHSFKSKNKVPAKHSNSLQESLVIANDHVISESVDSIQHNK